jgi:prolipoprotein diacylglyceryltransferase
MVLCPLGMVAMGGVAWVVTRLPGRRSERIAKVASHSTCLPAHRPAGYAQYATFHPTFPYELIWNLLLAGAFVWLGHHRRIRAPGLFALYVAGYSFARIGEELLRVDPAHYIFGLRLNFYVASILFIAGIAWLYESSVSV